MNKMASSVLMLTFSGIWAAPMPDLVTSIPGLDGAMTSRVFSGYIDAISPTTKQRFKTHYVFTESQSNPTKDPLVMWQQGGPGSSGLGFGYLAELGPYILDAESMRQNKTAVPKPFKNPYSFDHKTNLLIFEHPPGTGFSYCYNNINGQEKAVPCEWNDQTQAEAFANTIEQWYAQFAEYKKHPLYFIGESYAGLLLPFLVSKLIDSPSATATKQLRALAVGNGCPGLSGSTPDKRGTCNGPYGNYDTQHIFESAYGHSAVSRELRDRVFKECNFPCKAPTWTEDCRSFSPACEQALAEFDRAVGSFNIYNFMDNCGSGNQVRGQLMEGSAYRTLLNDPLRPTGGQVYPCGTGEAAHVWCNRPEVRAALHMKPEAFYGRPWSSQAGEGMRYTTYTGASFDLYPKILPRYRTTIYNGDVDMCVPYNSNEDWITSLATQQNFSKSEAWRPWLTDDGVPSGYVTTYSIPGVTSHNFTFVTIKGAGHMVPQYQPVRAFEFFDRWLAGGDY